MCKCSILPIRKISVRTLNVANEKHIDDSEFLQQIRPLLVALLFVGIDFRPHTQRLNKISRSTKMREIVILVANILNHVLMAFYLVNFTFRFFTSENSAPRIVDLAHRVAEIFIFILKIALYLNRQKVACVLVHVAEVYNRTRCRPKYLNRNAISVACSVTFAFSLLNYTLVYMHSAFETSSFRDFMWHQNQKIFSRMMPLYMYYLLTFLDYSMFLVVTQMSLYFAVLFAVLCRALRHILQEYNKTLRSHSATFQELHDSHSEATVAIKKVDHCFSLALLIALSHHVTLLFLTIHLIISKSSDGVLFNVHMCSVLAMHCGVFLVLSVFAALIHTEMQDIKTTVGEMKLDGNNLSHGQRVLLMLKIHGSSDDCITLWNSISITKSFIFSALGVILTYGVLLSSLTD